MRYDLSQGDLFLGRYEIVRCLGHGWEGEVYLIKERATDIERAAKVFYPDKNFREKTSKAYAKKLHKLQSCNSLVKCLSYEKQWFLDDEVVVLISEFVDGIILSEFLKELPGKKLSPQEAVQLLYALVKAVEEIHLQKEYHGDLHSDNVIVTHYGMGFSVKILDLFHWSSSKPENMKDDIVNCIHILYEVMGGQAHYSKLPNAIKYLCSGLKRSLILKKFKNITTLRQHLQIFDWRDF